MGLVPRRPRRKRLRAWRGQAPPFGAGPGPEAGESWGDRGRGLSPPAGCVPFSRERDTPPPIAPGPAPCTDSTPHSTHACHFKLPGCPLQTARSTFSGWRGGWGADTPSRRPIRLGAGWWAREAVGMALLVLALGLGLLGLAGLWALLYAGPRARRPAPRWPPGPRPLPLIGNLHLLRLSQQDRSLMEVSRRLWPPGPIRAEAEPPLSGASVGRSFVFQPGAGLAGDTGGPSAHPALGKRKTPHPIRGAGAQEGFLEERACRSARSGAAAGRRQVLPAVAPSSSRRNQGTEAPGP